MKSFCCGSGCRRRSRWLVLIVDFGGARREDFLLFAEELVVVVVVVVVVVYDQTLPPTDLRCREIGGGSGPLLLLRCCLL